MSYEVLSGFLRDQGAAGDDGMGPLVVVLGAGSVAISTVALDGPTLAALETITIANPPTSIDATSEDFRRLLKFEPTSGQELRAEDLSTDRYHGAAPDGTATSAASWKVVRFDKDAAGNITRVRYRTGVAWDSRAAGWS